MIRYIATYNDQIIQILQNEPHFVIDGTIIHVYEGNEPDDQLICLNGKITSKIIEQSPDPAIQPNSTTIEPSIDVTQDLIQFKQQCIEQITNRVEEIRSIYSSRSISQIEVNLEKIQEAIDYIAAGCPDDVSDYPFIKLYVEIYNTTGHQAATDIMDHKIQWITVAIKTERVLELVKIFLNKSDTNSVEAVANVVSDALFELNSIT